MRVWEAPELYSREPLVVGEQRRWARRVLEAGMRAVPAEDVEEAALQRVRLLAHVGEDRETAAGPQHAEDLGERGLGLEPVKRLRGCDRIYSARAARDRFCAPLDGLDAGRDERPHRGHRLDCD